MQKGLRAIVLLALIMLMGGSVAQARQGLTLSHTSTAPVAVDAGGVGTKIVTITNTGTESIITRLVPSMPAGWTLLIPPPGLTISAGASSNQLISFLVPTATAAGDYEISIAPQGYSQSRISIKATVRPNHEVGAEWIETPNIARAGDRIIAILSLINQGNVAVTVDLAPRSSLGYSISISAARVTLAMGESRQIEVLVDTRDDIVNRLTHSLVIAFRTPQEERASMVQLSLLTDILPIRRNTVRIRAGMAPVRLSLSTATEEGQYTAQIEAELRETVIGTRIYEALIRVPDVRNASVFALSDQYSFSVSSASFEVMAGDQTYESTDLLETGSRGFGAGLKLHREKLSVGGYVQQSRKIFPKRQQAASFFHYRPYPDVQFEANFLSKKTYEEGESVSFAAQVSPGTSSVRAEYALGWYGEDRGEAFLVTANTSIKSSTFSAEVQRADRNFLGTIQNTDGVSGAFAVLLRKWLRLHGQVRLRRRFYNLIDDTRAEQTSGGAKTGITVMISGDHSRLFVTLSRHRQLNDNTLSNLRREDDAIELRTGYNRRRLGMNVTLASGQVEDPLSPSQNRYSSGSGTLFATKGRFSFNLFGSYLKGPTFYNPVDQERITAGGSLGYSAGNRTQIYTSVFKSFDVAFDRQEFMLADARIVHEFSFGHEVLVRLRLAQTSADESIRDATFGVTYRLPLFVPLPGLGRAHQKLFKGRVVDLETGRGMSGVILTLDSKSTKTDDTGRFTVAWSGETEAYLTIDRHSIGLDRRPVDNFPLAISGDRSPEDTLEIGVIRSAGVNVEISLDTSMTKDRTSALSQKLGPAAIAGIVVEARSGERRIRRLTGRDGRAQFTDLVPGSWKIFAIGRSIPQGYHTAPDTLSVSVSPGSLSSVSLVIKSRSRKIKLVNTGAVSLGQKAVLARLEAVESPARHIVANNETLSSIARHYYKSTNHWVRIWRANEDLIASPDLIHPGQSLVIPPDGKLSASELAALSEHVDQ